MGREDGMDIVFGYKCRRLRMKCRFPEQRLTRVEALRGESRLVVLGFILHLQL